MTVILLSGDLWCAWLRRKSIRVAEKLSRRRKSWKPTRKRLTKRSRKRNHRSAFPLFSYFILLLLMVL